MIGYPLAVTYQTGTSYGTGSGPIFIDDLNCGTGALHINDCTYNTYDNCNHENDMSVVCTDCGDPTPINGFINTTLTSYGTVVHVTCEKNYRLIGDSVIICQSIGAWSNNPECDLIECSNPTPDHGFSNAFSTINGTTVSVECEEGYDLVGEDIVTCQENETWTYDPVCQIKDCDYPFIPNADVTLPNNITTFGETVKVSCRTGHTLTGNSAVSCLSNGSWEMLPSCTIVDCGDPTPIKGLADQNETTYGAVVEITCLDGYNITGNSTIICEQDGGWSSTPVCDPTGMKEVILGRCLTSSYAYILYSSFV
ncbi:sushi, von Willebrand factor type A, EGF and pentraxin domain-containing protein 1-like [Mercenaria mercenaria]|uniref:sushi, von Willebrand factor type A, EGF and pentraxin domain-containing protein 1-like n=1 Tax=Mercenaria mercenaria TaxID=6596 RepID=UPI00234E6043|nr:sushi, von Willebrand factor type A, EGF and pentraxin domain-containing protein 1-like [Mercenaria mercenaria]